VIFPVAVCCGAFIVTTHILIFVGAQFEEFSVSFGAEVTCLFTPICLNDSQFYARLIGLFVGGRFVCASYLFKARHI